MNQLHSLKILFTIGVDSVVGFRVKGEWEKRDFFGDARKFLIRTNLSRDFKSLNFYYFLQLF